MNAFTYRSDLYSLCNILISQALPYPHSPLYPLSNRMFSQIPVFNDELPLKILSGSVVIKPNIKEIRGSSVVFDDDSVLEKVERDLC